MMGNGQWIRQNRKNKQQRNSDRKEIESLKRTICTLEGRSHTQAGSDAFIEVPQFIEQGDQL